VIEFTGERVIPGEVNEDLWAEHVARYAFAARYAPGKRVLDLGCGSGYGAAGLARQAHFLAGIDVAPDAIAYARAHHPLPNAHFLPASAAALPFADRSYDLVTAFEVIEHVAQWRLLLDEARRVLHPKGVFLVSTPNKSYYAESRATKGPNPFHVHEFEFTEFCNALAKSFPRVTVLLQNRVESFAFYRQDALQPVDVSLDAASGPAEHANFFFAVCAIHEAPKIRTFLYLPRVSNLLREREQHIALLQRELRQTKDWLDEVIADRGQLLQLHEEQTRHLEDHNRWALEIERYWKTAQERLVDLQDELSSQQTAARLTIASLEEENRKKTEWALETERRLSAEVAAKCDELAEAVRLLDAAEATVIERTLWAQDLQARVEHREAQFRMLRESRWLKLGRIFGLGPRVEDVG
jgi:ubiquinone/menaquinone biosynthesis C-methylase UbiE